MISIDAQPIDGNLAIDAENQYGNHADYLDVNAIIQHGRISVDAYEKPAGLQCYIPLFNNISPVWGELALDAGSHVRASVATRQVPDTLVVETLANNLPRFEKRGNLFTLLDEPLGQNLIQYAHELGNVASGAWWLELNLTSVTANGMLAPDGNVVADGLIADANDSVHRILTPKIAGVAQNDKISMTVFGKPGDKGWAVLTFAFYDAGDLYLGESGNFYFDIANGVIGSNATSANVTLHDSTIEVAANGYYRIGMIMSCADAATAKVVSMIGSAHADADEDFPGNATTVNTWLWGADLKKQAYFDSPVATSGATATRATESGYPLYSLPLGLFDAEGLASVWARFGFESADEPNAYHGIISCADSAISAVSSRGSLTTEIRTHDGATTASVSLAFSKNTWYKFVVKWSSTTGKMRVGYDSGAGIIWGPEVAFDGSYTLGASLRLAFGLYGPIWFHKLMIFDRTATDIEINAHHGSP